jgi:hypothetical protein
MALGKNLGDVCLTISCSSLLQNLIQEINSLLNELFEISEREISWRQLSNRLLDIRSVITSPHYHIEEFRLRIFLHSVLPNLRLLHSKRGIAKSRFTQLQMVIDALFCRPSLDYGRVSEERTDDHPANTLIQLDAVIVSMKQSTGWWKTDFATDLEHTVEIEWLPILLDNRFETMPYSDIVLILLHPLEKD